LILPLAALIAALVLIGQHRTPYHTSPPMMPGIAPAQPEMTPAARD